MKTELLQTIYQWSQYYSKNYIILNYHAEFSEFTKFFQFKSTKSTQNTLLKYTQDLDENLKTLYSKLVTNNNYYHASYDANQ